MEEIILNALERTATKKRFREDGFIAGVIYGDNAKEATSVKFELVPLKKILMKHGSNAKVWLQYKDDKKFGFIKEIQRHPVTAKINHIDVQLVAKDHEIKLQLHIAFRGEEGLISKGLQLQIQKAEIDVFGKMVIMPDSLSIDVSNKSFGDTITAKDFNLDKDIKVTDEDNQIYASISQIKEQEEEEPVAEVVDEAAVVAEPEVTE